MRKLYTYEIGAISRVKLYRDKIEELRAGDFGCVTEWNADGGLDVIEITHTPEEVARLIADYESSIRHYIELHDLHTLV